MAALQRRRLLRCQRDGEVERRTVTDSALDPDLAAMHLDDLLNDREAQAGPGYRLGGAAADPPEAFEDMLDLVRRDAQPGVGDADERKTAVGAGRQRHRPAIGRVLDRIVDEVAQDLDETVAISVDDREARIEIGLEVDDHGRRRRGPGHDVGEHLVDVDLGQADAHPARLHAVEVEHVADQAVDPVRVIEYVAAVGAYLGRVEAAVADQLAEALDPGQRGPELVTDDGEELGLRAVQLFERGVGAALRVERLGEPVLGLADGGDVLDHHEHVLRAAARVGDGGRGHLQPQPAAAARRGADLDAALVGYAGQKRREPRAARGLVVRAEQVGPCLRTHRLDVVLEHSEEGGVPLEQLPVAAHARDSDWRSFVDGAMVRLASAQSLGGLRALDELPDFDARRRKHGHEVVLGMPDAAPEQLDDADRVSPADDRKGDGGAQAGPALRARPPPPRTARGPNRGWCTGSRAARAPPAPSRWP